jgi:uncharacterized protein involved in exopolysaccharide biosynthesis
VAELLLLKNLVKKYYKWILFIGMLGGLVGFIYAYTQKPVYSAKYKFTVKFNDMGGGAALSGLSGIASLMGTGGGMVDPFAKIIELAGSERIVGKALFYPARIRGKQDLLINHFIELEELKKDWQEDSTLSQVNRFNPAIYNVKKLSYPDRKALFNVISIMSGGEENSSKALIQREYDKKTGIISINVKHWNEEFAIALSSAVYQELVDFHTMESFDKMSSNVSNVKNKLDSIRSALLSTQMSSAKKSDQTLGLIMQEDQVAEKSLNIRENMLVVMLGEAQKNYETLALMQQSTKPNFTIINEPISPMTPKKKSKIVFTIRIVFYLFFGSSFF